MTARFFESLSDPFVVVRAILENGKKDYLKKTNSFIYRSCAWSCSSSSGGAGFLFDFWRFSKIKIIITRTSTTLTIPRNGQSAAKRSNKKKRD